MRIYPRQMRARSRRRKPVKLRNGDLLPKSLSAVIADEVGYALAIFVAAASGRLMPPAHAKPKLRPFSDRACEKLFWNLTVAHRRTEMFDAKLMGSVAAVQSAFTALWHEYEGSSLQRSVSARVLGFYYLMERTKGNAVEEWCRVCDGNPESVILHPAVVEALASVPLNPNGELPERRFIAYVRERAADDPVASTETDPKCATVFR